MAINAYKKGHKSVHILVCRRRPQDALAVLEYQIIQLASDSRGPKWREITKTQYIDQPDLLEYFEIGLTEVCKSTDENSAQFLSMAERTIKLLERLDGLRLAEDFETFNKLAYKAMQYLGRANEDEETSKLFLNLLGIGGDAVKKGIYRAFKEFKTPKILWYIGILQKRSMYSSSSSVSACHTHLWYSLTAKEDTKGQMGWAPILGEVHNFEENFVEKLSYDQRNILVGKKQILGACLKQVQRMCAFSIAVEELRGLLAKSEVPIPRDKLPEIVTDVVACSIITVMIHIDTRHNDFYDATPGVETWKPIDIQQDIVNAYRTKIDQIFDDWSSRHQFKAPRPGLLGGLNHPIKKQVDPKLPPVPIS